MGMLEPEMTSRNAMATAAFEHRHRRCIHCEQDKPIEAFIPVKGWCFNGLFPVCKKCIKDELAAQDFNWEAVDKMCQIMDIPFVPREFERIRETYGEDAFASYAKIMSSGQYEPFGWKVYYDKYEELKKKDELDKELPLLKEDYYADLALRWGSNYDHEQLVYLENLYNGLLSTQNVGGALQHDQAQKLCKLSLQIDERIRSDSDFDKLMSSYDKMVKVADFTPKNVKRDYDFSSFGEVAAWLEKRGWLNKWYDDANRDIVDEVIHSNQAFVQRLYTNESGLGDEINERIEQLKIAAELDKKDSELDYKGLEDPFFDIDEVDLESHDNEAYEELLVDEVLDSDTVGV